MAKIDVVYFYEHAARELDVACAVSAILQHKHGLAVEIVQWPTGFSDALYHFQPRLVVLPFCYSEKSYPRLLAPWRKLAFFNMSWEQLFYSGNQIAKTPRGEFALSHVIHHAWNHSYAQFLKDQGVPEEHIFLNGQPAYKLYDEPYRHYFMRRDRLAETYGMDPACKWVFFPENYNWAFYTQSTIDQFIQNGQAAEDVYAMQDYCRRSLKETVSWCDGAARKEKIEIILRPRPATSLDEFETAISQFAPALPKNFRLLKQESVRDWILASDMVISSYSTSLVEAAIAGKPVYMLEPYPTPAPLKVRWHDRLPHLTTRKEFLSIFSKSAGDKVGSRLSEWARAEMMIPEDAISHIAEFLSGLLTEGAQLPSPPSWQAAIPDGRLRTRMKVWSLFQAIKRTIRRKNPAPALFEYANDVLSAEAIQDKVHGWKLILFPDAGN